MTWAVLRRRWSVALRSETGELTELPFMRCWRRSTAQRWANLVLTDDDSIAVVVVRLPITDPPG